MKIMDSFNLNRKFKKEKKWFAALPGINRTVYKAVTLDRRPIIGTKIIYRDHFGNVYIEWVGKSSLYPRD